VFTGNENSKPIWNKFIIRKDIIETSQVVLNFCRTVYISTGTDVGEINFYSASSLKQQSDDRHDATWIPT
jgi:hypothetical protein